MTAFEWFLFVLFLMTVAACVGFYFLYGMAVTLKDMVMRDYRDAKHDRDLLLKSNLKLRDRNAQLYLGLTTARIRGARLILRGFQLWEWPGEWFGVWER